MFLIDIQPEEKMRSNYKISKLPIPQAALFLNLIENKYQ